MSVFEGENNQNTEDTAQHQTEETDSFVKKLVTSKGEHWSDPEVIAKGKIEADTYIEQLKKELEELKSKVSKDNKVDQLLSKIEQEAAKPTIAKAQSPSGTEQSDTKAKFSEEDIQSLVEKALTNREKEQTTRQNINQVDEQLTSMYGTEAKSVVVQKAAELGLSVEKLKEVASESPTAFFALIGEKPKEFKTLTQGTIRTEGISQGGSAGKRDNEYYQKLRKENPRLFGKLQDQMVQDRIKLGDSFYK